MKQYRRLIVIAVLGVAALCLATWGLYELRDLLEAEGFVVAPGLFLVAFFAIAGGIWGVAANQVKQAISRLEVEGK